MIPKRRGCDDEGPAIEGWWLAPELRTTRREAFRGRTARHLCPVLATIRSETADSIGETSKAFGFAGVVRGIVDAAGSSVDGSLRVSAKGAGHVDAAVLVDSSGNDKLGRLVLFAPAFEGGEGVELIGAGTAAAM